ncbi:unnamed protein product [Ectocarpus fasciculatus]
MKTLKHWGFWPSNDAWWFNNVLQPFSKEGNTKCLGSQESVKYASNEQGYLSSLLESGPTRCSVKAFLTDGVQIKLLPATLDYTRKAFSGSSPLNEAEYSKVPRADIPLSGLLKRVGAYTIF